MTEGSPSVVVPDGLVVPGRTAMIERAMDDDAALVARAQGGDRAAFAALVDRHQAVAFRVCYRVLGEREDAADATQEAFLRAYRRLDTFLGQSTFKTWFMRLTVNVALNERARRKDHTSLDEETLLTRPGADDPHDTGLVRAEAAAHLHQALQLLPPNHRAAVVLRDLEEFTYAETAMALGVPEGTAKGWAHRGRERLKDLLT